MSTAVIGAGWAGCATAVELARAGVPVTLFEAGPELGGRARRVRHPETVLDNGQHLLLGAYVETLRLIDRVAADAGVPCSRLYRRSPFDWQVIGPAPGTRGSGGLRLRLPGWPAPWHLLAGVVAARGLGWAEKAAFARASGAWARAGFRCDPGLTVAGLLAAAGQPRRLTELLWAPLCVAALNTPIERADAQVFLNVLRAVLDGPRAASDFVLPVTDLSALFPDLAAAYLERRGGVVRRGLAVAALEAAAGGFWLRAKGGEGGTFRQVVVAVGPRQLPALLRGLPGMAGTAAAVAALAHAPIATVYLQYPADARLARPLVGLSGALTQWVFDRGATHGQPGLVAAVVSAAYALPNCQHDAIALRVEAELSARLGLPAARWHKVILEKYATFACTPGAWRPPQRTPLAGLHFAGDYTAGPYPATLEAAVLSGVECAQSVLESS